MLDPALSATLESVLGLIRSRNAEVHLGLGDEDRAKHLVAFLRAINAMLIIEPSTFWAPHYKLVRTALDDDALAIQQEVQERIAAAVVKFQGRFGELPSVTRTAVLAQVEAHRDNLVDHEVYLPIECPACEQASPMVGQTELREIEVDVDSDGNGTVYAVMTFYARMLECDACGLRLEGSDELRAAALPTSWDNEAVDFDEWAAAQEGIYPDF